MTSNNRLSDAHTARAGTPSPAPADSVPPAVARPPRQCLKDLSLPPRLAEDVAAICRRRGFAKPSDRQRIEEEVKLQYFFGGQDVAYLTTADGLVIVASGDLQSAVFGQALEALSPDQRRRVTLYSPDRWNDPTSAPLTPITHEA
jgi:hypothetical protein